MNTGIRAGSPELSTGMGFVVLRKLRAFLETRSSIPLRAVFAGSLHALLTRRTPAGSGSIHARAFHPSIRAH